MKYSIILSVIFFQAASMAYGQNFTVSIDSIALTHDLMGGSVVVFNDKGILESYSFGKSDHERGLQAGTDTKFRIASISKSVTAVAIMRLADKKLIDLDSGIGKILGYDVKNPSHPEVAITPRMLLSHTSSLMDGSSYDAFLSATVNADPVPGLDQILLPAGRFYDKSQFHSSAPGSYFIYSNLNYLILGTLVEKVSGMRFDEYCRKYIFRPLKMDASYYVNDLKNINDLAVLYRKVDGVWTPQADDYKGQKPVFKNIAGYRPGTNAGRFGPQGGLRCSAADLSKFFMYLFNPARCPLKWFRSGSVQSMFDENWRYSGGNGDNYHGLFLSWGLGIHRITSSPGKDVVLAGSTLMLGHSGDAYGLISDVYYDPARKLGFVFITNGVGKNTQKKNKSAFYDVEQDVFDAIENYFKTEKARPIK